MLFRIIIILFILLISVNSYAQTEVGDRYQRQNATETERRLLRLERGSIDFSNTVSGINDVENGGTGADLSGIDHGSVFFMGSAGTFDVLSPSSTVGYSLISNGTGSDVSWGSSSTALIYTSDDSFVVPSGITKIWVTLVGAGGGGGGARADANPPGGGGGGAGEHVYMHPWNVTPLASYDIQVGVGGTGGGGGTGSGSNNGSAGEDTIFDSSGSATLVARGGGGGLGIGTGAATLTPPTGTDRTGGSTASATGGTAGDSTTDVLNEFFIEVYGGGTTTGHGGGGGASTEFGSGGAGGDRFSDGNDASASAYGAGGGGGGTQNSGTGGAGGDGADGLVVIYY